MALFVIQDVTDNGHILMVCSTLDLAKECVIDTVEKFKLTIIREFWFAKGTQYQRYRYEIADQWGSETICEIREMPLKMKKSDVPFHFD